MSSNRSHNYPIAVAIIALLLLVLIPSLIPQATIYASDETTEPTPKPTRVQIPASKSTPAPEDKPARIPVPADNIDALKLELADQLADTNATTNIPAVHFTGCAFNTGRNDSVAITTGTTISDLTLEVGDEIAIFTPDGSICAGVQIWNGSNTVVAAWGDDSQTTPVDGLRDGEEMVYRIWDSSEQIEHIYCQSSYEQGAGLGNGIYSSTAEEFHVVTSLTHCSGTTESCFEAAADAYVRSNYADSNYGTRSDLRIKDASADMHAYLKFNVQGVSGTVQKATLRLHTTGDSVDGGTAYQVSDTSWSEGGITWNNAPGMGAALGSVGAVATGDTAEFDVTAAVSGDGLVSLGVKSGSRDLVRYDSKEGLTVPQLCVEYQSGPPPAPVADFAADDVDVAVGQGVQFTDLSTGSPATWEWDFGDSNTSTEQNPSHSYAAAGMYTVTLRVTNTTSDDTMTKTDYITVTEASSIVCVEPVADAYVRSNYPSTNYGSASELRIKDASADFFAYLKFDVQGVSGTVQKATLSMYASDSSSDGGTAYQVSDTSWSEEGITWNNAPGMGAALGSVGAVVIGDTAEFDVTAAVTGNGLVSLSVKSASSDLVKYQSKEGANAPQLCIEFH